VAALQDWDGVYIYSYQHGSGSWDADRIQRFFDINGNPAKLALLATGALLFRRGDLSPAQGRFDPVAEGEPHRGLALRHRVGTELSAESFVRGIPSSRERRFSSDHGELRWIADDPNRARCLVDSPRTKLALGFIADDTVRLSGVEIQTGAASRGFGVIAVSALDGAPLGRSRRILVTTLANAENQGMEWNEDRTSVGDRWGSGPPVVEIVPAEISIRLEERAGSDGWKVYPLDARGLRRGALKPELRAGCLIAKLSPSDEAVWYEIVRESPPE
jgi:hypothetical protein